MSVNISERFQQTSLGEKIILIAGPLLLIDSFLNWYKVSVCFGDICASGSASGWEAPGAMWSILAVLIGIVMSGLVAVTRFTTVQMPALPQGLTWGRLYLGLGAAAGLFILIKLVNESSHLSIGFFGGIVFVAALIAGGFLMFQTEQQGGGASTTSM